MTVITTTINQLQRYDTIINQPLDLSVDTAAFDVAQTIFGSSQGGAPIFGPDSIAFLSGGVLNRVGGLNLPTGGSETARLLAALTEINAERFSSIEVTQNGQPVFESSFNGSTVFQFIDGQTVIIETSDTVTSLDWLALSDIVLVDIGDVITGDFSGSLSAFLNLVDQFDITDITIERGGDTLVDIELTSTQHTARIGVLEFDIEGRLDPNLATVLTDLPDTTGNSLGAWLSGSFPNLDSATISESGAGDLFSVTGGASNDPVTWQVGDQVFDAVYLPSEFHGTFTSNERRLVLESDANDVVDIVSGSGQYFLFTGDDRLNGGSGEEQVFGGDGNDTVIGNGGNDDLRGGNGNDSINAGSGDDTITGGNGRDLVFLNQGDDLFIDSAQDNAFGQDTVFAGNGNDTIQGGGGNDEFSGGDGDDSIDAGFGADEVLGGSGADTINAGGGADTVTGGNGRDLVFLNLGNDLFIDSAQSNAFGQDTVFAGGGNDTILGGGGDDEFAGGDGNDSINAGLGADEVFGGRGNDSIDAGDGNDTVTGGNGRDFVFLNQGDDLFIDNAQSNAFGQDTVFAGNGNDTIQGGGGNDRFFGEGGADVINGGAGNDTLTGGDGVDTFIFEASDAVTGVDLVTDYDLGTDVLEVLGATPADVASIYDADTNTITVAISGVDAFVLQSNEDLSLFGLDDITII
ncbi:MAG: calcium-binding protein [Tateyamaria sp.]|uniref:calcium-binding protein n=1 Tax=Tateyamaria sp. TaxID=1929288 RepID=UPI00329F7504